MKKYTMQKNYFGRYIDNVTFSKECRAENMRYTMTETIEILNRDGDVITYCGNNEKTRRASLRLAPWARRLHGNAPCGIYYGRYIVQLSDGARVSIPVYVGETF